MAFEEPGSGPEGGNRGCVIVILGPSGSGKDSLLDHARQKIGARNDIRFIRRAITRPAHDESEDFLPLTEEAFEAAVQSGRFCFHWRANGLRYGLPHSMAGFVADGGLAVVNGSRAAFPAMCGLFPRLRSVLVRVDSGVLRERLRLRGREDEAEIDARISRAETYLDAIEPDVVIDNSGSLESSGAQFLACLRTIAGPQARGQ
jgi:ribose 1,5-bisphosphokinase